MSRPIIVVGDRTTHGGHVISGDPTFDIDGKLVARVGDMTVCPKCRGTFPITTGADDVIADGARIARDLDSTACGAKLIAGQALTLWDSGATANTPQSDDQSQSLAAAARIAAPVPSGLCLDCLLKAAASGSTAVVRE